MAVPGARWKRVGEHEWDIGMLTVLSDWPEEGRRGEIDERGRSFGERQWRLAMAGLIPAGEWRNRAREVVVEVRGEGDQLEEGSGSKNGGGTAGAVSGGARVCLAPLAARGRRTTKPKQSWPVQRRRELKRRCGHRRGDAWRRRWHSRQYGRRSR